MKSSFNDRKKAPSAGGLFVSGRDETKKGLFWNDRRKIKLFVEL